eukprot:gene10119-biopygen1334
MRGHTKPNKPCPCGSRVKFKKCCGSPGAAAAAAESKATQDGAPMAWTMGERYQADGRYTEAVDAFRTVLRSLPANHPNVAGCHNNIGAALQKAGDNAGALVAHRAALAIQEQSLPPTDPDIAASHNNIGNALQEAGDHAGALVAHRAGLAMKEQSLPPMHPKIAMSHHNIGNAL